MVSSNKYYGELGFNGLAYYESMKMNMVNDGVKSIHGSYKMIKQKDLQVSNGVKYNLFSPDSKKICRGINRAIKSGNIDIEFIKKFLEFPNIDLNIPDDNGDIPLCLAAKGGHTELVQLFLEKEADVNQADNYGATALHWAALCRNARTVQLLLENGADVNKVRNNGTTPLCIAAEECLTAEDGCVEVTKLLIASGKLTLNSVEKVLSREYLIKDIRIILEEYKKKIDG